METLDNDGDGECDFQEFVAFIAMVTTACHEFFEHEWTRESSQAVPVTEMKVTQGSREQGLAG